MANEMTNIEMRNFTSVTGVDDGDSIILVLASGAGGKMGAALFKSAVTADVKPSIQSGYWWVGSVNTGVEAVGKTPEFRKGALGIEWKYTTDADSAWRLLVNFTDISFRFEDLTPGQQESLKLKFSDLTAAEIAELQKPAADMIAELKKTDEAVTAAEKLRMTAEQGRSSAEQGRERTEQLRVAAEGIREGNETARVGNEAGRSAAEALRVEAESDRVTEFALLKRNPRRPRLMQPHRLSMQNR